MTEGARTIRYVAWSSWSLLALAVLAAATALISHWGVNAQWLGARDLGLAILLAYVAATALIGSTFAAPVLALFGLVSLYFDRRSASRFLAAAIVSALPILVLTWLE